VWGAAQGVAFGTGGVLGTVAVDAARLVLPPIHAYGSVFAAEAVLFLVGAVLALRIAHAPAPSGARRIKLALFAPRLSMR